MRIVQADPIETELERLAELKNQLAELQLLTAQQTALVADMLELRVEKSKTYDGLRFTRVQAERSVIDEDSLRKDIGARAFNKLTIRKVDQSKIKEAINAGTLDAETFAKHAVTVFNKPSIRISEEIEDGS